MPHWPSLAAQDPALPQASHVHMDILSSRLGPCRGVTAVGIISWGAAGVFPEKILLRPRPARMPAHLSPITAGEEPEPWVRLQSSVLMFMLFPMMVFYQKTRNTVRCTVQWSLTVYPPYIEQLASASPKLPPHPFPGSAPPMATTVLLSRPGSWFLFHK